jgi:hypothetical protein
MIEDGSNRSHPLPPFSFLASSSKQGPIVLHTSGVGTRPSRVTCLTWTSCATSTKRYVAYWADVVVELELKSAMNTSFPACRSRRSSTKVEQNRGACGDTVRVAFTASRRQAIMSSLNPTRVVR